MTELAALAGIGLAVVATLGALVALLLVRRRRAAALAAAELEAEAEAPPAPVRRRNFGPGIALTEQEGQAGEDDSPSLPAFVTAAQAASAHEAAPELPPSPAASQGMPSVAADALAQAVVFRQIFPPPPAGARSFYGGVPLTPAPLDWPRSARTGLPLHFLLQVDCAQVAPSARLTVLPGSGALLFFADLTGTPGHDTPAEGRVIWIDESDEATWTEADPPADLPRPMPVSGRKAAPRPGPGLSMRRMRHKCCHAGPSYPRSSSCLGGRCAYRLRHHLARRPDHGRCPAGGARHAGGGLCLVPQRFQPGREWPDGPPLAWLPA
jgi:hypothetical protein